MYLSFYGLREWPFSLTTDPRFYCAANSHTEARRALREGILARRGLLTLAGSTGSGKTLLLEVLREELKNQVLFGVIPDARQISPSLLELLAEQFGLERDAEARVSLPTQFHRLLLERHRQGNLTVLLVDKADEMESSLLASLCLLTHHEENGSRLLQIVLCGDVDLDRRLRRLPGYLPHLHGVKAKLHPLTKEETDLFVQTRLRRAGTRRLLFTGAALETIYKRSQGNPCLINQLCDGALLAGFEAGVGEISAREVERAAEDFEPLPGTTFVTAETTPSVEPQPQLTSLFERLAEPQTRFAEPAGESTDSLERGSPASSELIRSENNLPAIPDSHELASRPPSALLTQSPEPPLVSTRWATALVALMAMIVGGVYWLRQSVVPATTPGSVPVRNAALVNTVFTGKLHPAQEWKAVAPQASTVRSLPVKIGEFVTTGQVLLLLDDTEAKRSVELARIERDLAAQERTQADTEKRFARSNRATVAAATGEVALAQRRAESVPVPQRQESVNRARAVFEQARLRLERYERLYRDGLVSQDKYEEQATAYSVAEADLQAAEAAAAAQERLVSAQQSQKEKVVTEAVQADAAEARQRVAAVALAGQRLERAEAQLKLAEQRLADCTVRATADGYVIALSVGVGDQVAVGTPLATLANLETLLLRVAVSANLVDALHEGGSAQVTLPTVPPQTIAGTVIARNPVPDQDGTHRVEVEIKRPEHALLVGQPAEVRFQ
ncbi:MAG: efflux RND transporter periplasmic adaptor subunit [Blastocatellia bacterium]|nr:efflux RND transporter periplasmic adaptor subunit [Blastocatellia bacterium]